MLPILLSNGNAAVAKQQAGLAEPCCDQLFEPNCGWCVAAGKFGHKGDAALIYAFAEQRGLFRLQGKGDRGVDRFPEVAGGEDRSHSIPLISEAEDHVNVVAGGEGPVAVDGNGTEFAGEGTGDGPVAALIGAIDAAVGSSGTLLEYSVSAVTDGPDALGEARVLCEIDGRQFTGQGVSPDVLEASAIAYIRAVTASRNADVTERMAERGV